MENLKLPELALSNKPDEVEEIIKEAQEKTLIIKTNEESMLDMYEVPEDNINEVKYVKSVERIIRSSMEYRRYIQTIRREFDINSCKFYNNIDTTEIEISLEMHHYPASLFDIVYAIREARREIKPIKAYETFSIAHDVMKLHYEGKIGLVPLTKTSHELAHSGALFIPLTKDYVFGDYEFILDDSNLKFDDLFYEKYEAIKNMTDEYKKTGKNVTDYILNTREVEVQMKSAHSPMKINKQSNMEIA